MKRFLKILVAVALALVTALSMVACTDTDNGNGEKSPGVYCSMVSGKLTLTKYVDDGETEVIDLGAMVTAKYGKDLQRVKAGAFDGNDTVLELIVPTTVNEIDAGAFRNMYKLEKITLPFVGATANADSFQGESADASDKAVDAERTFGYVFGKTENEKCAPVIFTHNGKEEGNSTYYLPINLREVTIASASNYNIPMYAFCGATLISKVNLGSNVKGVGDGAFMNAMIHVVAYNGTATEWANVRLGKDWNKDANPVFKVVDSSNNEIIF